MSGEEARLRQQVSILQRKLENQARQHECSLALGLATDPTTCCSKRRIRYLRPSDAPRCVLEIPCTPNAVIESGGGSDQ